MIVHNLPQYSTSFVGRKAELSEVIERLLDPQCRLLTLVGPGGIGKTRLAMQVSSAVLESKTPNKLIFQDGIYFVALQALISSEFNLSVIADSLNLQFSPESDPEEQLLRYLRPKSLLLVLDNFEHLLDGAGLISRLLFAAPHIKVLATSREALNLQEEWLYTLDGMGFPTVKANQQTSKEYDSVQFFAVHARRVHPAFSLEHEREGVTRICQLVQGMPLALELASSWVRSLPASEIANEIERGLDILEARTSNIPSRHRSMRATLNASWNRLSDSEQQVFKMLAVFRGGFTREAAEMVAHASRHTLAGLMDKSWLHRNSEGRYDIHELLRQYGEEHLNEQLEEAMEAHDCHCKYYAEFLAPKWEELYGAKAKQIKDEIEGELENIWAYWEWAISHQRVVYVEPVLYSLWYFYDSGNRFQEGVQLFAKAAQAFKENEKDILYGKILMYQGTLCHSSDHPAEAQMLLKESLRILQPLGVHQDYAFCLMRLAIVTYQYAGDITRAKEYFHASHTIYQQIGFLSGAYTVLSWLGIIYEFEGNLQKGKETYEEALRLAKSCNDLLEMGSLLNQLGGCSFDEKRYQEAQNYGEEALACFQKTGTVWGIAMTSRFIALTACKLGHYHKAQDHILQALTIEQKYHLIRHTLSTLNIIAELWIAQGEMERAVEFVSLAMQSTLTSFPKNDLQLLEELIAYLPIEKFEAAFERGKKRDFDMTIQELINEFTVTVQTATSDVANPLTKRETEILHLVARGFSNQAIASELVLAVGSVKWYMSEILSKLHVSNRTQAVIRAHELNLLSN